MVLARQIQAERPLHRCEEPHAFSPRQDILDQREVCEIVLDQQHTYGLCGSMFFWLFVRNLISHLAARCRVKHDLEGRALPHSREDLEHAIHPLDEVLCDRESYARPFDSEILGAEPFERLEELAHVLLAYADAGIGDRDADVTLVEGFAGDL